MTDQIITQEELQDRMTYHRSTGVFTWQERATINTTSQREVRRWNTRFAGKAAGCRTSNGYIAITVNDVWFLAHRLAWLYVTGRLPHDQIDHIDGDGTNNSFSNLREVDNQGNARNRKVPASCKTGVTGVRWRSERNKWASMIMVSKERIALGHYTDFFEACCARKSAELKYGFHVNHGRAS